MADINEKTRVPLFAVLVSLPVLVGGIIWLTTIDSKASAASEELKGLRDIVQDIQSRVIRIEQHQLDETGFTPQRKERK